MNYIEKPHVTTCNNSHTTNDVKKMKNHFSRRRSADRGKRDEKEISNNVLNFSTLSRDIIRMKTTTKINKSL